MEKHKKLNQYQQEAIDVLDGPLLVLAGAGSGKTQVVTLRIAKLLEKGIEPSKILGLTFTNKAAKEMKERVQGLTQQHVLISTFHSLGTRILRESIHHLGYRNNFVIYDEDDADQLLKACLEESNMVLTRDEYKKFRKQISLEKNHLKKSSTTKFEGPFFQVCQKYNQKLKEYNAVDYDDLLALPVKIFEEFPSILEFYQQKWSHLLIDEYQDTNPLQYALVNFLVAKSRNLCVVGDPDQSIYSWRGANIHNILNFEHDYPGARVIRLEENYRSTNNILEAANHLIANNENRYEKKLWSSQGPGEKIKCYRAYNDLDEALFVAKRLSSHQQEGNTSWNQMVVFYRTNAQSRVFEDCFLKYRIPYVIVGGISFYQRREIKDILAWLRMTLTEDDFVSFNRTINIPKRGLGDSTLLKLRIGASEERSSILAFCQKSLMEGSVKLSAKQKEGLKAYLEIIQALKKLSQEVSLSALVTATIDLSKYCEYLAEDKESMNDRKENLNALIAKAAEWESSTDNPSLSGFLEELSLKSTLDEADSSQEKVSLMTIHHGKGLEFSVSFLVGMEEGLFPHINSQENQEGIEEERRLCYVGMTRAKKHLYLSHAETRHVWGVSRTQRASRFLSEIPPSYVEKVRSGFQDSPSSSVSRKLVHTDFGLGDMIFHQEFGVGCIKQVYDGSAGITYRILFSRDGTEKNLVAKHANLHRI